MRWRLILVLGTVACAASESERASQAAERQQARDSLRAGEVVESLATPDTVGRLIYEAPPNLSYDSLRVKRPDLVRATDRRQP